MSCKLAIADGCNQSLKYPQVESMEGLGMPSCLGKCSTRKTDFMIYTRTNNPTPYISCVKISHHVPSDAQYALYGIFFRRYFGIQLWFPEYFKRLEHNCPGGDISNGTLHANCSNATALQFYQDTLYTALASLPGNIAGALLINIIGGRIQLG